MLNFTKLLKTATTSVANKFSLERSSCELIEITGYKVSHNPETVIKSDDILFSVL
jgi:hypothetical protein